MSDKKLNFYHVDDYAKDPFYKFPQWLMADKKFTSISARAKLLYMYFLDRNRLSYENNFTDDDGYIYFICKREHIMELLDCGYNQPRVYMDELKAHGLIYEVRQYKCKANRIYLLKPEIETKTFRKKPKEVSHQNSATVAPKQCNGRTEKVHPTIIYKEELKHTESVSQPEPDGQDRTDYKNSSIETPIKNENTQAKNDIDAVDAVENEIKKNIEYESLVENNQYDVELIDEFVTNMVDVIFTKNEYVRIGKEDKPRHLVKRQFMRLNHDHIERCLNQFKEQASHIKKKPEYIRTMLYNATLETDAHYTNLVNYHTKKE